MCERRQKCAINGITTDIRYGRFRRYRAQDPSRAGGHHHAHSPLVVFDSCSILQVGQLAKPAFWYDGTMAGKERACMREYSRGVRAGNCEDDRGKGHRIPHVESRLIQQYD